MKIRQILDNMLARVILALVLGILCGLFFGEKVVVLKWVGDLYVRLLQMTAIPYVVVALIHSIGKLSPEWARRIGARGSAMILLMWVVSLLTVLAIPLAYPDWPSASYFDPESIGRDASFNPLALYIPSNVFASLATSAIPAVIVFCISFGIALIWVEGKTELLNTLDTVVNVLGRMAGFIAKFTPIAFFALSAHAAGTLDFGEFSSLQIFVVTFFVAWLLFVFWTFPLLVALSTPFSYQATLRTAQLAMVTAFAAGTMLVALPLVAEGCKKILQESKFGDQEAATTVDMMVPIAYSLPKAGTFLGLGFVLFGAWFTGSSLALYDYPGFIAVGGSSVFAGLTIAVPFMLDFYDLPSDLFQLYALSWPFTDNLVASLSAMYAVTLSLLAACAVAGRLHWRRLGIATGLGVGAAIVIFASLQLVFAKLIPFEYTADKEFLASRLLVEAAEVTVITDPEPLSARAQGLDRLSVIQERGSIRVGYGRENDLPFIFRNSDDELVGLDVELAHTLARDLGVRLELVEVKERKAPEWLASGRVDLVLGAALTPDRATKVAFTQPYVTSPLGLVVPDHKRHEFTRLGSVAQLPSLKIAAPPIRYLLDPVRQLLPNAEFVELKDVGSFFKGELGDVDTMLYAVETGAAWTLLYPGYTVVVPAGFNFKVLAGFVVPRAQVEWLTFLNSWLDLNIATGEVQRYTDYWIRGETRGEHKKRWSVIRDVLKWVD